MDTKHAFLLIHGFGGAPFEIEPLAVHLESQGCTVRRTRLAGHTGNRRDLRLATREDWLRSADEDYQALSRHHDSIILVGFSTGGLIAANLAVKYPVTAVVTISTPIYVWDIRRILANIVKDAKNKSAESLKWYFYSSVSFPLTSLIQFKLLLYKSKPLFSKLTCPIYSLQGLDDDTVNSRSADFIYRTAGSAIKKIDYFEKSGHVMLNGPASGEAIQKISAFIESI